MSTMYNLLFGVNPMTPLLLGFLETSADQVPRFRECYIDEQKRIVIYTRTGGGNRDWYESEASCRDHYPESFLGEDKPSGPWNADLRKLPGFLYDEDDEFDCTYASFYYQPSEEIAPLVEQLTTITNTEKPAERFRKLLDDMHAGRDNAQVRHALAVGEPIIKAIIDKL